MMSHEASLRAAQAVWPWRHPAAPAPARPAARRWRAVLQAAAIAGVATLLWFWGRHPGFSLFLYALGAVVLISGLFVPFVFNRFEQFGRRLGQWAGVGLTWLLLAPFFYLCIFPGRLILLLLGKDPMCRRREPGRDSYWTERKPADPKFYTRQY